MNDADYQEWLRRLAWFESERTAERVRAKLAHKDQLGGCVTVVSSELVLRVVCVDDCDGAQTIRHYSSVDEGMRGLALMKHKALAWAWSGYAGKR